MSIENNSRNLDFVGTTAVLNAIFFNQMASNENGQYRNAQNPRYEYNGIFVKITVDDQAVQDKYQNKENDEVFTLNDFLHFLSFCIRRHHPRLERHFRLGGHFPWLRGWMPNRRRFKHFVKFVIFGIIIIRIGNYCPFHVHSHFHVKKNQQRLCLGLSLGQVLPAPCYFAMILDETKILGTQHCSLS